MLSRSLRWLMVLLGLSLMPPAVRAQVDANISPGSVEGQGFGQIAPTHNASIALHSTSGPFYPYISGAPNTVWTYTPPPGSTLDVTATGTVREDEMSYLTVGGYIIQGSAMMASFNLYIANVTFPCKYPVCDPANPMSCMSCDPVNEGEISIAPGQTVNTSIRVSKGLPGTLTVTPPSTQLQILDANGNPFTPQSLGAGDHLVNIQIRASSTFTGQGNVLAKFVHTAAVPAAGGPSAQQTTSGSSAQDILVVKKFQPPPPSINLEIFNGQFVPGMLAVADDKEESVGAFTVANSNDTDGDGKADNADANGVLAGPTGRNEVDLMKLVLHKPIPDNGGNVTLTVVAGSVVLWNKETHETKLAMNGNSITFRTDELDKEVWVELTAASKTLRDVTLKLTYQTGSYTVRATGIWAKQTGFRNINNPTTLTGAAGNSNPSNRQIVVADRAGFAAGDHIVIHSITRDATGIWPRAGFDIAAENGKTLTLNRPLGRAWAKGDEVRMGMSAEIGNLDMISSFVEGGGKLGAAHVLPVTNNAMEMQFTVGPPGIGAEPGIVFDISRQRATFMWERNAKAWIVASRNNSDGTVFSPCDFPSQDENPNDDSWNKGQRDEDNIPTNNHIYSRDMPNVVENYAFVDEAIVRHNMFEFVRVRLDGVAFTNKNGQVEGSRCSPKTPWHSRLHVISDPMNTEPDGFGGTRDLWKRMTSVATDNRINLDHLPIHPRQQ